MQNLGCTRWDKSHIYCCFWKRVQGFGQGWENPQVFLLLYVCFVGDYIKMSFFCQNLYLFVFIFLILTMLYIKPVLNIHWINIYTASLRRAGPPTCLHPTQLAGEEPEVPNHCWVKQLSFSVFSKIHIMANLFEGSQKRITGTTAHFFWHWSISNSFQ